MPRKAKFPPEIRPHPHSGQDRCWVNGRWVYLGPTGSEEARQAYARLVAELSAGKPASSPAERRKTDTGPTVADVLCAWWLHAEQRYSAKGRELEQFRISLRPLERLYGDTPAREFRAKHLETVLLAMAQGSWLNAEERASYEARCIPAAWSAGVCNRRLVRIRTLWKWAEKEELVPGGSYNHLLTVSGFAKNDQRVRHREKRKPPTWDQTRAVARHCPASVRAILLLHWWSGMRSEEVRTLRVGDVDTSAAVWLYSPRQHKTQHLDQQRIIPLGPKAQAVLRPWLERARQHGPDAYVFPPEPGPRRRRKDGSEGLRPPYDHRRCYSDQSYPRAVARAAAKAGVEGYWPYGNRHAFRMRIGREMGDEAARATLGHKHISTTEHYGARDLDLASEAARRLG